MIGMDRVPGGIDPRDFVGKKLEEVEHAGDGDDGRIAEHFERLILRRERDPVLVDRQPGDENRQVKVDPGERRETESNPEEVELFHGGNMWRVHRLVTRF